MASDMEVTALVSSSTWLQSQGLRKKKLTLPKVLARLGFQKKEDNVTKLGRPVSSRYSHGLFQQYNSNGKIYNLTAKKEEILQKIECYTEIIELYNKRLDWLKSSSRLVFGVIQEKSIVIILDLNAVSKVQHNLSRDALCLVLREQVAQISNFNLIWVSYESEKWQQKCVRVTQRSIQDAVEWIWNLQHSPVAHVESAANAVLEALEEKVDAIYYFSVGQISMEKIEKLGKSVENISCPLHIVCYNPPDMEDVTALRELSQRTSARFHVYFERSKQEVTVSPESNEDPDVSEAAAEHLPVESDLKKDELLIINELKEAKENLSQLQDILKTLNPSEDPSESTTLPVPEDTSEDCVSSRKWLKKYGLKPQKLLFYDALADCAFRHSEGVVDIKTKPEDESLQTDAENNLKLISAKYCDRFVHILWKDGSVVHIHISKEKFRWYEERMKTTLDKMERRVSWLRQGSRDLFGTILEDHVYILIDTSHSMKDKLFLVKEKIFQLMQEQLKHKKMFNFVKFDSKVEAWKAKLAEVNEENMKEAWFWVKELKVGSSTNTMKALQLALCDTNTEAVYLLTDGRPDQPTKTILGQVKILKHVPVHTIAFNCDDTEANNFLYQLSSKTGGRFHSYNSYVKDPNAPQPFMSEDIQLLLNEIKEGKSNLEKIKKLHNECLMLDWYHNGNKDNRSFEMQSQKSLSRLQSAKKLKSPSHLQHRSSLSPPRLMQRKKANHAEHTRSSLLRALTHGVRLSEGSEVDVPAEGTDIFLHEDTRTNSAHKEGCIVQEKKKKLRESSLNVSSSRWLKTHGLVARRLTIMDALAPTTVPHSAKYVPILDKHIVSKVFDKVFPLAHISGNGKSVTLINPKAVNLSDYKEKLEQTIKSYERRLNLVVWRALSQEERDNFDSDVPISYLEHKDALMQALDRLGWPIAPEDVMLLEDEILAGNTYLQQATDLQEAVKKNPSMDKPNKQNKNEENEREIIQTKPKRKHLDTLRSQKVIARSDIDGLYYPGTVLKSINSKCALVDFWQGENHIVPIKFIIQIGGALPCPTLKVGDCVFSKTGPKGGGGVYVPAVVIATPRTEAADKLYTVMKYNNRKEHCLRSELIKISPSQFAVTCNYIRKAQMIDYTIPSVQLVKPLLNSRLAKREKRKRSLTMKQHPVSEHAQHGSDSDLDSSAITDAIDPERKIPSESISKKLEDLQLQISQHQKELKENQEAIQVYLKELTELNSRQDKCKLEEVRDLENQKIDLLEQLKMLIPIRSVKNEKDDDLKQKEEHLLLPGHRVLSVCSHNGWYEEGTIIHDCGNLTYFVQRSSGEVARIQREEILSDADDYRKDIKEDDHVIGPHPAHPGSFCPGVVLNCTPDLKVMIQYYDDTEACAPREDVYLISQEKYEQDTAYILTCEEQWVGQPVVARNDDTGSFHLAEVQKRTDDGKKYIISWADGKTAIQDIEWIFGKFSKPHVLRVGAHVLTLAYPSSLTFLPGIITALNGKNLKILFCDGESCQNVEPHQCFGLSENKYNSAVHFYHQKNQTKESDDEHTASEIEDSLSDISSFTISSIGSTKKANR